MRTGIDLTRAGLSVEEGFVASQIDGRTTLNDIAHIVGKTPNEIEKIIDRLAHAGVVLLGEAPAQNGAAKPKSGGADYGQFIFPPNLMMEDGDLASAVRKRIIFFHAHLEEWNHYELLQAKKKDDSKTVKKAYFSRSKEWHPDRFRKPNLGSFKRMIDDIFKAIQEAYAVLSDRKARKDYDKTVVFMVDEDDIAEMLASKRKEEREKKRVLEKKARRKKRNPVRRRLSKAKTFFEEAKELEEKDDLVGALRAAQSAVAFDPSEEHREFASRLREATLEFRVDPFMKRGGQHEMLTNWEGAIDCFQQIVDYVPDHGPAQIRLAFNMLMGRRNPQDARVHAAKGVTLCPEDAEAHFVLGLCYEHGDMRKAAVGSFKRAVELRPNYKEAKKRLKKLKWGF